MAEKKLTSEELDQVGLSCIEIDWDNKQKLTTLFHHYVEKGEPLPAYTVNDQGDAVPNLSLLARLGKVKQGKQVFKTVYGSELIKEAIQRSGVEDLTAREEQDETQVVREHLQDAVDAARRTASTSDVKLQTALDEVRSLTEENNKMAAIINSLRQQLAVAETKLGVAEDRVVAIAHYERTTLKRTF